MSVFRLKRGLGDTASEIAENKLFESMEKDGLERDEFFWECCPAWIDKAMKYYAGKKCEEQRENCEHYANSGQSFGDMRDAPEPNFE